MQLAIRTLSLQQSPEQPQGQDSKDAEEKDGRSKGQEKDKKEAGRSADGSTKAAPQVTDIQRVNMYFTNISLVGSYACEPGQMEPSESRGGKQAEAAEKTMSYLEKVSHLRGELRALLSRGMRGSRIKNSVYRLGTDQNLKKMTYGDIRDSLDKIMSNEKLAK